MGSGNESVCDVRYAAEDALDVLKQMSTTDYHFCVIDSDYESHDSFGLVFDVRNWRGGASRGCDSQAVKFASLVY